MALDRPARRRKGGIDLNGRRGLWLFLIPAAAIYIFIVLYPSIQGAALSFTDWNGLDPVKNFIGWDNYVKLFHDPKALASVWHTLVIAVTIMIVQNLVGLLIALGVNSKIKSRNVLRVIFFAPAVITPVATGYLWQNLLGQKGAVNEFLSFFGVPPTTWLGDQSTAIWAICVVIIWQFAGYSMVIFLANLQGIPQEIIEASMVDGAGPIRRFWSIIRPELAPSITINLMLSIIGGLKIFDQVWVMTGGGPGGSTETMSTFLYKNAFQFGDFAYGIAIAVVLAILVGIISGGQFVILGRQNRGSK
jgi:raffinose/stachyose/melibiose transport system permease protein